MDIAVVGLGYWGSKHVRVLDSLPEVDRVVGVDTSKQRRDATQAAFPNVATYSHLDAALDLVDALVIATAPATHCELGTRALAAKKHVLVEKPLAMSSAQSMRLIQAAGANGRTLMVGHTFVYNPAVTRLCEIVQSGDLGRVLYLDSSRLNLGLYRSDCDVLWDLAPHDISIANLILNDSPVRVSAWGRDHIYRGLVDNAYLHFDYPNGAQSVIHISWLDPHKVRRTTVVGSRRMAVYNDLADDQRIRIYDKGVNPEREAALHSTPLTYRYGDIVAPYIQFREPLVIQAEHFIESIRSGDEPRSGGEAGLDVVRIIEAAELSLQMEQPVDIRDGPSGRVISLPSMERVDLV